MNLRVSIIGAGAAGSAAAYSLAKRGANVSVFDQYAEGHDRGASHGESRLIRLAYFEHPGYAPLLRRAYAGWSALEAACGETLFQRTGLIEAGPVDSILITGLERASKAFDLSLQTMSPEDAATRCAGLQIPRDWRILYEDDAGYLLADRALAAFRGRAAAHGAQFHWKDPALGLSISDNWLKLTTQSGVHEVDRLIVAPGPWSNETFATLGLNAPCVIRPVAKLSCWYALRDSDERPASFGVEDETGAFFYVIPAPDGGAVKAGAHYGGAQLENADTPRPDLAEEAATISDFVRKFVAGAAPEIIQHTDCLYEKSPDGHFVVDRTAEDPRIAYAIGLSGHGFKFAPVIGDLLAERITDAAATDEAAFISASRFR